jgi:serine/threonine protein kinase
VNPDRPEQPERLDQLEALYNEALALPAAERPAFLGRVCGNDSSLLAELTSLLGYEKKAEGYLNTSAMNVVAEALAENSAGVLIDRMLGRYQLLSLVGRGGMGEVYCAVDTRLNRLVAVKVLPPYLANDPEWLRRFEQEARAVAALNHPHICTVHDIGSDDRMHYMVFEYLIGELLSDRLSRGDLPLPEALGYAAQIGEALMHAHEHGIIHLDLKPQNIMLTRTGVKVFDFGIAVLSDTGISASGGGTPGYLAPEQREGRATDARTDVFSFGVVMYELFTGRSPFDKQNETPRLISDINPAAPKKLDVSVSRCLENDPAERWPSIAEVLAQLSEISAGL